MHLLYVLGVPSCGVAAVKQILFVVLCSVLVDGKIVTLYRYTLPPNTTGFQWVFGPLRHVVSN